MDTTDVSQSTGTSFKDTLRQYMARHDITSPTVLAKLIGSKPSTVQDWIGGVDGTRKTSEPCRRVRSQMIRLLKKSPEEIRSGRAVAVRPNSDADSNVPIELTAIYKQVEVATMAVEMRRLMPLMKSLIDGSPDRRKALREMMGKDFEIFLNQTRALTSETARTKVIAEKLPLTTP